MMLNVILRGTVPKPTLDALMMNRSLLGNSTGTLNFLEDPVQFSRYGCIGVILHQPHSRTEILDTVQYSPQVTDPHVSIAAERSMVVSSPVRFSSIYIPSTSKIKRCCPYCFLWKKPSGLNARKYELKIYHF